MNAPLSTSKLKVLYISHSARSGGAEKSLLTLIQHLDRNRFEPVVVVPSPGPLQRRLEAMHVPTITTPLQWWIRAPQEFDFAEGDLRDRVTRLSEILAGEKPHLVHSNTSVVWEGALAARLCEVPHLWHVHELLETHPVLRPLLPHRAVYGILDRLSAAIVPVSEAAARPLRSRNTKARVEVIHNGIKGPTAQPALTSLRGELGIAAGQLVALTVGSLVPEKGYDTLLNTAALTRSQGASVAYVIAGGGTPVQRIGLRRKIEALGLQQTVFCLGFRDDVQQLMDQADLFLLTSVSDAFPMAVLEAMASGKPVLATDCGGPSEMVLHRQSGYIVPVGDAGALSQLLVELSEHPERCSALGQVGRRIFESRFTADCFAARFQSLYEEVVSCSKMPDHQFSVAEVTGLISRYQALYLQSETNARRRSVPLWHARRVGHQAKAALRNLLYR